ncbi:hypothetical protein D8B26_007348 [Coccidioides posadasii str. Silveira]|uniref:uncharacterized protein n=1 Tax=Coccidioides posadasii (strain RMSCC 757 / Silveira) TaxID=443226 RepID=UPI001BEEBDCD|nr:hypothetical protein D8B26_007348 [Coccidioides posadasii str. Silveira]
MDYALLAGFPNDVHPIYPIVEKRRTGLSCEISETKFSIPDFMSPRNCFLFDKQVLTAPLHGRHVSFLKVSALLEELESFLNHPPESRCTVSPPTYSDALKDLPPGYTVEDAPRSRIETLDSATLPAKKCTTSAEKSILCKEVKRPIDWNDPSRFRECAKGKKKKNNGKKQTGNSNNKGGGNDEPPPPEENDLPEGGNNGAGDDGGNGDDGAGGGGEGGGDDEDNEDWMTSNSKKSKKKKKAKKEEEEEEEEEERKRKEEDEEEQKAKDEEVVCQTDDLSWADADGAAQDDGWAEISAPKKKKKGKAGKASEPPPAETTQSNGFENISLEDSAPQSDMPLTQPSGNSFGLNAWGKGWYSDERFGHGTEDGTSTEDPVSTNPWSKPGKKGKTFAVSNAFEIGFGDMENDFNATPPTNGDNFGGNTADDPSWETPVTNKKNKKKRKGAVIENIFEQIPAADENKADAIPEDATAVIDHETNAQAEEVEDWSGWATTTKSKKKKKKGVEIVDLEPEEPAPPPVEPEPPVNDAWSVSTKKSKKKKQGAAIEEVPIEPTLETVPEVNIEANAEVGDDTWPSWGTTTKKSKKKKGKTLIEEELSPPPAVPEDPAPDPEPVDDLVAWATSGSKKDKKKAAKETPAVEEPPTPTPEPGKPTETTADGDWGGWGMATSKKSKKKKGKAGVEEIPPPPPAEDPQPEPDASPEIVPEPEPEPEPEPVTVVEPSLDADSQPVNEWTWATANVKKKKSKKGKEPVVEDPPPPPPPLDLAPEPELTFEPEPEPESQSQPVDNWFTPAPKKKKGKKSKAPVEPDPPPVEPEPVPEPEPEPTPAPEPVIEQVDDWGATATISTKKSKKKKGKGVVEEPLPPPPPDPAPEEIEPKPEPEPEPVLVDDWAGFTLSKKKKGKKGAIDPAPSKIEDIIEPLPEESSAFVDALSRKEKRKASKSAAKGEVITEDPPILVDPIDATGDLMGDALAEVTKVDTSKSEGPKEEDPLADWTVGSKKKDKKKKKKGDQAPVLESEPVPVLNEMENTTADDSWFSWDKKKDKSGDKGVGYVDKDIDLLKDDALDGRNGDADGDLKDKAAKDLDIGNLEDNSGPPAASTDAWDFWGSKKRSKGKTAKAKNPDIDVHAFEIPPSTDEPTLSIWAQDWGLSSKEKKEKDKENENEITNRGIDNDITSPISTELVPRAAEDNSWDIWNVPKSTKKKKKKAKDEGQLPPPAPTPPAQGLDPEPPIIPSFDDTGHTTWDSFSGFGGRGVKKGNLSRTTTSTSQSANIENIKLSKTKTRGLEVVDVTDEPGTVAEADAKGSKASTGIWGGSTAAGKSKASKSKREPADTLDDGVTRTASKDGAKPADELLVDAPEKASAAAADKAETPPRPTTSSPPSTARPTAKSSVAERIRILEQKKRLQKQTAAARETERALEIPAPAPAPEPAPAAGPPADEPVEPAAQEPPDAPAPPEPDAAPAAKSAPAPSKRTKKKTKNIPVLDLPPIEHFEAPRDSVPGSFPGADDDLVDVSFSAPGAPKLEAVEFPESSTEGKKDPARKEKPDSDMASPPPSPPAQGENERESAPVTPTPKPAKKERARVERTAGATSWGFWGAAPRKSPKKEGKGPGEGEASATPKRGNDKPEPALKRSKSSATRREKSASPEKNDKSSTSDKEKEKRAASRPRPSRGLSFSGFMLGGPPPARTKSARRNGNTSSRPTSRRQSMNLDDSGLISSVEDKPEAPSKAAKVMGINNSKPSRRISKSKKRSSAPADPYAIDDDDIVMVNGTGDLDAPRPKAHRESRSRRRSKRELKAKDIETPDDMVMVEPGSSGHSPEVISGPDDIAFVETPHRERSSLRRSTTLPKKSEGLLGLLGSFRKNGGRASETRERGKSKSRHDEDGRRHTDTEREDSRRMKREEKRRRSPKIDTDGDVFMGAPNTDVEDTDARKAERRARKAARMVAEQEAREAEERRASRRDSEKHRTRESREKRGREEEERDDRRRREKKARRSSRVLQDERPRDRDDLEQAEPRVSHRRHKHRAPEGDVNGEIQQESKSRRRRSYVGEKRREGYPDEYAEDEYYRRRHHRPDDEGAKPRRRKSTTTPRGDERHTSRRTRSSRRHPDVPYPVMVSGGKDKTSSWVQSQFTDPPEAPPIVPTVIDLPAPQGPSHSLSSDEEARRAILHRRSRRHSKYGDMLPPEKERRSRRRESRRAERDTMRSSDDSAGMDRYADHRYESDARYNHTNGTTKVTSWFKKFTGF